MGIRSDTLAATRLSICQQAMKLFVERGVAATKMEDILEASGVSVGSFYYLFKNKVDLAITLYLETQQQFFQALLEELARFKEASSQEGIEAVVRAYLNWVSEHPKEMYYLAFRREFEILKDERESVLEDEFYYELSEWLQVYIEKGEIRAIPPEQCLALWFGPTEFLVRSTLNNYRTLYKDNDESLFKNQLSPTVDLLAGAAWLALRNH